MLRRFFIFLSTDISLLTVFHGQPVYPLCHPLVSLEIMHRHIYHKDMYIHINSCLSAVSEISEWEKCPAVHVTVNMSILPVSFCHHTCSSECNVSANHCPHLSNSNHVAHRWTTILYSYIISLTFLHLFFLYTWWFLLNSRLHNFKNYQNILFGWLNINF